MKKQEFLDALRVGLTGSGDAEEVLDFYREMIEDRMEDGMEEEAAVEQLGSVEEILARCVQGLTVPKAGAEAAPHCGITRVEIREREFDVTILPTTENTYRLEVSNEHYHNVTLENGTLRIVRNKQQKERRFFSSVSGELTLYLPEGQYQSLDVTTASGDIEVRQDFGTVHITGASSDVTLAGTYPDKAMVQTASGDVSLDGIFGGELEVLTASGSQNLKGRFASGKLRSASGDMELSGASFTGDLTAETASGDMTLSNVLARGLRLRSASGDVHMERVCAEILNVESRSGDLNLEQVLSKGDFLCKTTSGDVSLEGCDSPQMGFTTVSGHISGSLLHGKQFSCRTVSGEMNLPGGTPRGTCSISTVSGDADLEIEEE
ncbi:DUF4097 family beta strand repeat protein [Pseudoflavonifractor sp. MSJ-30]|uniref:DUF4097 family beta strand repeat-containing protein n=1 Tax=Pseudoflavonifractor sp. MSJ-30 TaxID=2841525 RepID=UPI001C114AFD|nr:DUF4097 family beta strand repeat-containing protein [Pseudoflavonifractor sp. MSJ-30]MBU5452334.1 DUF4097 family beta strand repeat protein [Pseudoflavonifractor sp. MSJ-30]